jgi:hypothetical protein
MAVRQANIKGIKFLEEPTGADKGGVALITFDMINTVYTAAADTIALGGGGQDAGVTSTDTLAVMISKRRRDGKTITLTGVAAGGVVPMKQAAATNGPTGFVELAAVSGANINAIKLFSAVNGGGSELTLTAAAWDQAAALAVTYTAT